MTEQRIKEIQNNLSDETAVLITSDANRFYLTGFSSSAGTVLIFPNSAYFLIDFRYYEKAKQAVKSCDIQLSKYSNSEIKQLCEKHKTKKLFIEADSTGVSTFKAYREAFSGIEVSDEDTADRMLEDMRSVKSEQEFNLIKQAQKLTDETFSYICENICAGRSERDVMLDMEFYMRKLGSEGVSFDFIVVSGKNSSLPHGVPTEKKIEKGDFVTMDFGAVVGGYRSDMTRTVAIGNVSDEQRAVYETVLKAQKSALCAIRAGAVCRDIDKIARDIINGAGYNGCFGHGLGHSVGIEIHENPNFNTRCEKVLKSGNIMTVEPGIYLENRFGVRIEDMVYITDNGCIDITNSIKDLIIL